MNKIDINVSDIELTSKLLCMKFVHSMQEGRLIECIHDTIEAEVSFRKCNNKLFMICKRADIEHILHSKVFIYKNKNVVRLLRKSGLVRSIDDKYDFFKVPVGNYAKRGKVYFEKMKESLFLKNLISKSSCII